MLMKDPIKKHDPGVISEEKLEEFKRIYKTKFGKDLTKAETLEKGLSLMNLMKTIILENERQRKLDKKKINMKIIMKLNQNVFKR